MFGSKPIGSLAGNAMTIDRLPLSYPGLVRRPRLWGSLIAARREKRNYSASYLITVDFEAPDGQVVFAVGGGSTLDDAVGAAREALRPGPDWKMVRWNHVHGE